jgi:hypothetical protein
MADTKISALSTSTVPLAGTEVLPIVQGGVTKQVSVANLTDGRAISAAQLTLSTGSLNVPSGQGIDFSATPGTGTSELLNDYEEGTFTATLGAFFADPTVAVTSTAIYTKIGRQVTCTNAFGNVSTVGASGAILIRGLPFTPSGNASMNAIQMSGMGTAVGIAYVAPSSTTVSVYDAVNNANIVIVAGVGKYLLTTVTYFV